jgi:electron transfer flavoprotein beta subunit
MNILVCIKPDMTKAKIGPFELLALEAGLVLKAACPDTARLDVITAGPALWQDCLVRALGTGADQGIHMLTLLDTNAMHPAAVTAGVLARALLPLSYDLILTGVMSQDLMAGQTGPMLARMLDIPCATGVVRMDLTADRLVARREMDGGMDETLEIPLPALVSVQSGHYCPRYPVLSHMLKAKEKPLAVHAVESLPIVPEQFFPPEIPQQSRKARVVTGPISDQVAAFDAFLRERGLG